MRKRRLVFFVGIEIGDEPEIDVEPEIGTTAIGFLHTPDPADVDVDNGIDFDEDDRFGFRPSRRNSNGK